MTDLHRALSDISAIRSQLARGTEFRGYGPATLAATAGLAAFAGVAQTLWLPDPGAAVHAWLALWSLVAAVSVLLIGIEMTARARRAHGGMAQEMVQNAVEQFLPAGLAGVLLTVVLARTSPETQWMLPGLWQLVFSLGVFASCRFLPAAMFGVGVWYLATGLACLVLARDGHAFSPYAMSVPFAVGQLAVAAIIYLSSAKANEGADDAFRP